MKNQTTDTDRIIERIDQELLYLYYASKEKNEYCFFDFYGALQSFIESALKEGRREEYFKLKRDRYHIVFRQLMTELPENHYLRRYENEEGEFKCRDESLTRYALLTENLKIVFPRDQSDLDNYMLIQRMLFYFSNYFIKVTPSEDDDDFLSFDKYVEDWEFQEKLIPEKSEISSDTDASVNMTLSKSFEPVPATTGISLTLESVFADAYRYDRIMQILVERNFCQAGTFIWINLKKGYKKLIVSILKYLYFQNYYKSKAGISNHQIQQIALNTFHVITSIDTIKHAGINPSQLNFIPAASTIKENCLKIVTGK